MAKYYGKIGYSQSVEVRPGIFKDEIILKEVYGDMNRVRRSLQNSGQVIDNIVLNNELSIVADPFALNNFQSIKYVEYLGAKWKVTSAEVQFPRIILSLGEVYNGEN